MADERLLLLHRLVTYFGFSESDYLKVAKFVKDDGVDAYTAFSCLAFRCDPAEVTPKMRNQTKGALYVHTYGGKAYSSNAANPGKLYKDIVGNDA